MTTTRCAACLLALTVTLTSVAARADEPLLLGIEAGYAMPVASPQLGRFEPGGTAAIALHVPLAGWIAPVVRARGVLLGDGAAPADTSLRDPGVGTAFSVTAGLRLRPRGLWAPDEVERATDLWIEVDAGAALTGSLVRPVFEVGIGYALAIDDVRIGPSVRFAQVLHFDDAIDGSSAFLMTAGLELVLFDRRAAPPASDEQPASDRDRDGLLDEVDACPDEPEDADGFADDDGCPDLDDDRDGIPDPDDACAREPEDLDGFADDDGCPDLDDDHDGIADHDDACPREPETVNGVDDRDGCPDEGLIEMVEDRIVIEETVLFDFGRARVKHAARPVLAAIVELWRQHPEWARMRVEGHTDSRGPDDVNQRLSELRAERVRDALLELGMPADRIEIAGYAASRPRDTRATELAYQRNRRVEFVVVERETAPPSP